MSRFRYVLAKQVRWILFVFIVTSCINHTPPEDPRPVLPPVILPTLACNGYVIDGYTDKVSYHVGDEMKVYLNGSQLNEKCRLTIYNLAGDSIFSAASSLNAQAVIAATASADGYNYESSAAIVIPEMKSGVYLVDGQIPFLVKTSRQADVVVVYPSNTENAYCSSGGKSLYSPANRPTEVSFQRPMRLSSSSEFCLQWFSRLDNINVAFIADADLDDYANISSGTILVIAGHSEYWTRQARINFDTFVNKGGHALVLSGNTMWWQVRYSANRSKLICYKETTDPVPNPLLKTILWNDPSLNYPIMSSIGADFQLGGYGLHADKGWNGYKIVQPLSPLFEGLNLKKGDIIKLPSIEYDGAPISGFDNEQYPLLDLQQLNVEKIELLAFDRGFRSVDTTPTFIVYQRSPKAGIIINAATTDWCSANGMGGASGDVIKKITMNALTKLLSGQTVFAP